MSAFSDEFSFSSFKRKPTILQVIPALKSGGVEIGTLDIAKAILSAGGRALVAAKLDRRAEPPPPKEVEFINLPLNSKNPLQIFKNSRLLQTLILKEKIDLVHARSRAPAWSAYKAARSLGVPFMTTYHGAYHSRTILKTFYNSVMARGDRIIAISQFIKDHLTEKYGNMSWFDPTKIRLIQRGIDIHYFDPARIRYPETQHLRERWKISPQRRVILLPGRISRTKGHEVLIKALSLMKHGNVTAVFVGSTQGHESYKDGLLRYATSLGLENCVKWFPPYPDIPVAYQLADIVVTPSLVPEGFGRVVIEALAMKKPIIASQLGAPQNIIEDGIMGWLAPPGNAEALAQALDTVLNLSKNRLEDMGERGREYVKVRFSKEQMCTKTIAVYRELLELNH